MLQGYAPNEFAIQRFTIVEGQPLTGNRQILLGRLMADTLKKGVGDTIELSGMRFRVVGIYESNVSWEQMGGVITLRDAQNFVGRPRKVSMVGGASSMTLRQAQAVVDRINAQFPRRLRRPEQRVCRRDARYAEYSNAMLDGISFMAILVGGVGVLNTMLMAVFERTREIGVLRALGWRRRGVLGMILRESVLLGLLGGLLGIAVAFGLIDLLSLSPTLEAWVEPAWSAEHLPARHACFPSAWARWAACTPPCAPPACSRWRRCDMNKSSSENKNLQF